MPVVQERSWTSCIYAEREERTRTGCQMGCQTTLLFFTRPQGIVNEMTGMREKMFGIVSHITIKVSMKCLGGAILFVIIPALYIIVHAIKMGVILTA